MTSKTHRFASCHRHPTKPVTGFCASCLRERLAGIESSSDDPPPPATQGHRSRRSPELRRTKSCSGSGPLPSSSSADVVPRRRSCEVRLPAAATSRNKLSDLFDIDDGDEKKRPNRNLDVDSRFEITVEERENGGNEAVRVCVDDFVSDEDYEETKTMKEFIDLELRRRKNAGRDLIDIAGSFCKRLRKWRRKRKSKENTATAADDDGGGRGGGNGPCGLDSDVMRGYRETQSEVGEYGFLRRRSCDTDPRLSVDVDAGRMSLDDSRLSFEAARASWDGYLIGRTSCARFSPMVHVNERVLEENEEEQEVVSLESGGENCPGGSSQTKDYYSDAMNQQRRRRSFDRSSSRRKQSMADVDELRVLSNAKVSPATNELFYGAKVLITDQNDSQNENLNGHVQSAFAMMSGSKNVHDVANGVNNQKGLNKFHKWVKKLNKLGLVQRKREAKAVEEERGSGDTVVNKPVTESWQKLRRVVNGNTSESVSQKLIRSYSVSCRNPCRTDGLVNGFVGTPETNGSILNGRKEFTLQRNRSVSYSPGNVDTGLLRFYFTPLKNYKRSISGKSSSKD
ncbi:hypothetical protein HN51_061388 [Arachis hypogaea]|uniref:Uncharacterized protein n=2 Tax=Arachis TaxID=3817 RepID=A0A445AMZ9_ARAHY|nr:protein OCTOPUS-like [Arachis hypogaea]QHO18622.1 UPF0503 protein [Arachis hypogaea]RYR27822.1 hypothetical protein Ahy_B01g051881 [Arachis hypogaea]